MSFTGFPTELPAITRAVSNLLSEPLGPPPDMRSLGQKTFDVFQENKSNLDLIRKRDWRHVPYAIWLNKDIGLQKQSEVIDRYFEVELAEALNSTRRPLKWGRPLVFVYVEQFNLRGIYKNIIIGDILDTNFDEYDYLIMGDVLEHMTFVQAKNLLDKITAKDKLCLVAVPYMYEQGTCYDNVYETHHQPDLTKELFLERYPQMQYLCGDDHYGYFVNYDFL